jgi:hypothetical protein
MNNENKLNLIKKIEKQDSTSYENYIKGKFKNNNRIR